jgi:hypothetical protein
MAKNTAPPAEPATVEAAVEAAPEARNVAVQILENGLKIGNAICGIGPCSFPLTASDAKALEALGKVRIVGLF